MSSQSHISEFDSETEPEIEEEPQQGHRTVDARKWDPTGGKDARKNRCECGRHVTTDMPRVFAGDGKVQACLGCATIRELVGGAAAGADVPEARSQFPSRGGGMF